MLIDATHPEETRVAVVDGKKLEEFDIEIASRKPLKGNIYLAKVTRVEPSLQAAFVEYGGNRHGFLAFSEIHPDYYRIPVADREALKRETAQGFTEEENFPQASPAPAFSQDLASGEDAGIDSIGEKNAAAVNPSPSDAIPAEAPSFHEDLMSRMIEALPEEEQEALLGDVPVPADLVSLPPLEPGEELPANTESTAHAVSPSLPDDPEADEERAKKRRIRALRRYKIQEVIKRRQIMLIQVTKEERGNKGAALTTYLSLAGRYCVLMPNTDRGGGISRRITSINDRKRLKAIMDELEAPPGMAVILRTAGSERSKIEVKRDYEYLLRLWDDIRELTLKSTAPALIYEEANLIKRSIRDLYTRDIENIVVAGDDAHKAAKDFMKMLMPSHAKRVLAYRDPSVPLFQRYQVESQIAAIHDPIVQLKSGGYIVINQTEALVAIDVNSGKATRERNIEETASRTNLEAADEIARQLRLRDLAGLIVIDFIDMEENRHNAGVEKRLKEALRNDRARIQLGRISMFGLLEMSRQRLNPSLAESSTEICLHCNGTGRIRSVDSTALHILRMVEEELTRQPSLGANIFVPSGVALYILNQKRQALSSLELRHGIRLYLLADDSLVPPAYRLERLRELAPGEEVQKLVQAPGRNQKQKMSESEPEEEDSEESGIEDESVENPASQPNMTRSPSSTAITEDSESDPHRRRRRGRRGGRRRGRRRDEETENHAGGAIGGSSSTQWQADPSISIPGNGSSLEKSVPTRETSSPELGEANNPNQESYKATPALEDSSSQEEPKRGWWRRLVE